MSSGGPAYIVGAYEHPTRHAPDKSGAQLHAEVALGALADAGLSRQDVDGYFCAGDAPGLGPLSMVDYLNLRVRHVDTTETGGSSYIVHVAHAAQAIAAGKCNVALITLAGRPRSEGTSIGTSTPPGSLAQPDRQWEVPFRPTVVNMYALCAKRHMHEFGTTSEQLAWIKVAASHHAQHNPRAMLRDVVTVEDVVRSPLVADPLHRLDCCVISDGGGALLVARPEIARSLARPRVRVRGAGEAIKGQDGAFTGYFTGQSKAIKVSKGDFSTTSTIPYKAAGLTVVSNEWLRNATPDGLSLVGEGLRKAVALAIDSLFLSATGISNGVSPAGILNGTSAVSSNGGDAQSIATDIKALFAPFITAKNTAGGFYWVMTPTIALALSLMKNALGQPEYPTLTPQGGTFMGYPVVTGDNMGTTDIILIKPSDVWRIGDLGATLSISTEAMIEQADDPTGATDTPVAATNYMVSMFQEDSTAIKVVRPVSWGKRRAGCAQYITDADYGAEQS